MGISSYVSEEVDTYCTAKPTPSFASVIAAGEYATAHYNSPISVWNANYIGSLDTRDASDLVLDSENVAVEKRTSGSEIDCASGFCSPLVTFVCTNQNLQVLSVVWTPRPSGTTATMVLS
jgi:hypothetical protein